eukprot:scaffold18263_cov29-Tisochrysis_lutea.AAC.4
MMRYRSPFLSATAASLVCRPSSTYKRSSGNCISVAASRSIKLNSEPVNERKLPKPRPAERILAVYSSIWTKVCRSSAMEWRTNGEGIRSRRPSKVHSERESRGLISGTAVNLSGLARARIARLSQAFDNTEAGRRAKCAIASACVETCASHAHSSEV